MTIELEKIDNELYTKDRFWAVLWNFEKTYFLYKLDTFGFYSFTGFKDKDIEKIKKYIENHT